MPVQADSHLIIRLKGFARATSLVVILFGGLVLFGWVFELAPLKGLLPGLATMKPNTALAFVVSGMSLWLLCNEPTPARQYLAQIGAVFVTLLALLTLSQDLFGWNLRLDQLLFQDSAVGTAAPGRMSPVTAFNFILVGSALLLLDVKRWRGWWVAQLLALTAGIVALLTLVGYAYNVQSLYYIGPFASVALHTALNFLILALAILCAHPDQGIIAPITAKTTSGLMLQRLLPAAIVLPFVLGWLRLQGQRTGLYDTEVGLTIFAFSNVVIFTGLILWNACRLQQMDVERRQAEEALRVSEEKLRTLFALLPVGISIVNKERQVVEVNPTVERILGFSRQDLLAGSYTQRKYFRSDGMPLPPDEFPSALAIKEQREVLDVDVGMLKDDGVKIWLGVSAIPVTFSDWKIVITVVDITERKRAEEALRQTAAELARSNADLEQFAYIASHDLQEPLRAVAGTVQLLQQRYTGRLDARADELIRHAVEGASRMQTLINDLLNFSRIATRGQPFHPTDCVIILRNVLANLAITIKESKAVITHEPLPTLMADPTQLTQLFQNLIGNAIKFRGETAPVVHIRATRKETEYLFAICDNGIGMEAQYFERIFAVFQRLHTRREYQGTGIGLAICKKIIERHGGRIWVESQPGQGATFYFTLPDRSHPEFVAHQRE